MADTRKLAHESEHTRFWTEARRQALHEGFKALLLALGDLSPEDFHGRVKASGFARLPSYRTFRRVEEGPSRWRPLSNASFILAACRRQLSDVTPAEREGDAALKGLAELGEALEQELPAEAKAEMEAWKGGAKPPAYTYETIAQLLKFLGGQMQIAPEAWVNVARLFFPGWTGELENAAQQRNFVAYRFQSEPGLVVKSFVALFSPSATEPYCRFALFFNDGISDEPRETRGLVFPMNKGVYFLGQTDKGAGLKLMAFSELPHGRLPNAYHGLALTMDGSMPVAARFVMRATDQPDHAAAGCRVAPFEELRDEIGPWVDSIRNRIEFSLEGKLSLAGKTLSQEQMVTAVDESMRQVDGQGIVLGEGDDAKPFNPASTKGYTYNAALPIYGAALKR